MDPFIISGLERFEILLLEVPYHITKTIMTKPHRKVIKGDIQLKTAL